jgi:hypothetical protein
VDKMKITKRQLRRIIKEERAKLLEQAGLPRESRERLNQMRYDFEKAISSGLGLSDRFWYEDPETMQAVMDMLDDLKAQMEEYSRMPRRR